MKKEYNISSNLSVAQKCSNNLSNSLSILKESNEAIKDNKTTVSGNTNVHFAIDLAKKTEIEIEQIIIKMSQNINKLSNDFQSLDEKIKSSFEMTNTSKRFSINGR